MIIIETSIFTRQVQTLLSDEEYCELQNFLVQHPKAGRLMIGSAGLRKLRWVKQGKGKRGGVRVIYYWTVELEQILMLFIYSKSEKDDLTPKQIKILKGIIKEEYNEK